MGAPSIGMPGAVASETRELVVRRVRGDRHIDERMHGFRQHELRTGHSYQI